MSKINVSRLMVDPAFSTYYTVLRRKAQWVNGRFIPGEPEILKYYGPVQPATQKELDQLPEGDRQKGTLKFFCKPPLKFHITNENGEANVSDEIIYKDDRYKIFAVKDWTENGYIRAFAYSFGSVDHDTDDSEANSGN